jgi:hypothetical protein
MPIITPVSSLTLDSTPLNGSSSSRLSVTVEAEVLHKLRAGTDSGAVFAESDEKEDDFTNLPWMPLCRNALRLVGLHFDAIRVEGPWGKAVADHLAELTHDTPGPVILDRNGRRATYFLVPVGGTGHRTWPAGVIRQTGPVPGERRNYFIGIPAYYAPTWPLSWHSRPTPDGRLVNPALLHAVMWALAEVTE